MRFGLGCASHQPRRASPKSFASALRHPGAPTLGRRPRARVRCCSSQAMTLSRHTDATRRQHIFASDARKSGCLRRGGPSSIWRSRVPAAHWGPPRRRTLPHRPRTQREGASPARPRLAPVALIVDPQRAVSVWQDHRKLASRRPLSRRTSLALGPLTLGPACLLKSNSSAVTAICPHCTEHEFLRFAARFVPSQTRLQGGRPNANRSCGEGTAKFL